jgi:hypothetical protein
MLHESGRETGQPDGRELHRRTRHPRIRPIEETDGRAADAHQTGVADGDLVGKQGGEGDRRALGGREVRGGDG